MINAIIGTYQEWSSRKSSEKLANMIKIDAKVRRENESRKIDSENIVVGDIVLLESGDKVPADLRLIETNDLTIDESILTGESIPKEKDSVLNKTDTELADRTNIAYAGSIVTKGRGVGIVLAVAKDTEFGKVADKVLVSQETKSPLVTRMDKFTKQISIGFILLASILSFVLFSKGYEVSEIFATVVALTVSAIPEGLSIAMTIVLSLASARMAKKHVIVKKLDAVESLGSCSRIATDKTGTLTANEQTAKRIILPNGCVSYAKGIGYNDIGEIEFDNGTSESSKLQVQELAYLGLLNNEASLSIKNGKWIHHGDAIDTAFLALAYKLNLIKKEEILQRIPYESKQKYSAVVYEQNHDRFVTLKGATEKILEFCDSMYIEGKKEQLDSQKIIQQANELSKEGFRVISIAKGLQSQDQKNKKFSESSIPPLTFIGMVAFVDPIREHVVEAIQRCKKAGIKVSMLTGDHPLTANSIAKRLEIDDVHARVSPIDKLEIVENYKEQGDFIAVTGDGVNDTPALKAANIGIAMGSGTDIAKETGNMILADDNFPSIVNGIEEGRRAYNNIRKVVYLLLSTGFSEIFLFVFAIFLNLPIPLVAIQLLWLNLISNGIQGGALAFENDIEDVMNKKVKKKEEKIFNKLMISETFLSSFVIAVVEFIVYLYLIQVKHYDMTLIRTYMLTLMVFMENVHIFNCRSESKSIFQIPLSNNKFLMFSILITTLIQVLIVITNHFSGFFQLTTLTIGQIGLLLLLTIPVLLVMEVFKMVHRIYTKS